MKDERMQIYSKMVCIDACHQGVYMQSVLPYPSNQNVSLIVILRVYLVEKAINSEIRSVF